MNININLEGSILGEVLDATYVEPVNLKPTNYCTAMWNGVRCDGSHEVTWMQESGFEVFHSARGESGRYHSMWRDGYGGIRLDDLVYAEGPDFDSGWGERVSCHARCDAALALDRIHARGSWGSVTSEPFEPGARGVSGCTGTFISGVLDTFVTFEA